MDTILLGCQLKYPNPTLELILEGPTDNEWDDGDEKHYDPAFEIFNWRSENDSIRVFIYESDPSPFRKHEPISSRIVSRQKTLNSQTLYFGPYIPNDDAVDRAYDRGAGNWTTGIKDLDTNHLVFNAYVLFESLRE